MIHVSNAWANAQRQTLLPEMFVEITYMITNPGVQEMATVSANYPEEFSDVGQVIIQENKNPEKYATLDYGCWGLDGSFGWFNGFPVDPGYVDKNYSNEECLMEINPRPKISMNFELRQDTPIPGVTITWDKVFGGWATDFVISAYDANGMIAQTEVHGNTSQKSIVWIDIVEYTNVTVEILKWSHPFQRYEELGRCFGFCILPERNPSRYSLQSFRKDIDRLLEVDLKGTILGSRAIMPIMIKQKSAHTLSL